MESKQHITLHFKLLFSSNYIWKNMSYLFSNKGIERCSRVTPRASPEIELSPHPILGKLVSNTNNYQYVL